MKKKRKQMRICIFSFIFPKNWRDFASFILTLTVKIWGLKAKYSISSGNCLPFSLWNEGVFFHCLLCVLLFCQEPSKTWICAMPQIPSWWSSSSAATWGRTEPRWPPQVWQLFKLIFNKWMYAPQQKQQRRMKTFTRKIAWYLHV